LDKGLSGKYEEDIVMRKAADRKLVLWALMIAWVLIVRCLSGCSVEKDDGKKVRDLEFTVIGDGEVPQELMKTIEEKKGNVFKLTYSDGQNLYIITGYGQQPSGGYSIRVEELYLTENSIVIDTELQGPENGEQAGKEPSYPYIVIKTEYLENPVVFQ
jgi:hypothetical protein